MTARYLDNGSWLMSFNDEVLVRCSRCARAGVVVAHGLPDRGKSARFTCGHCALRLTTEQHDWVGPVTLDGRQHCGHCGHRWLHVSRRLKDGAAAHPISTMPVDCPACARVFQVSVCRVSVVCSDTGIDPHFGLPLHLVQELRLGTLWAYNARHLQALRDYVHAALRERSAIARNRSMISRLPQWMKQARHRAEVLRGIGRLEAKLLTGHAGRPR